MANDGQIVFEVTADGKHAIADIKEITRAIQTETKNWDKAAEQSTTNIGNNFSSMLKKLVAGFSAVKIGKELLQFGKDALEAASDLKEVQNVVDVTFGDNANQIEKWAKNAGDQFGLTETQAKKFSSTMGAMLKSAGLAGDQIVDVSTDLAGLAADMASFYNLDFEEAFAKIRSGISGQTMPLKELGIDLSVATLNAFALQKGLTKTYDKMSQGEQTMLRYQYLMQATADAQGDFSRTSDEYANSMRKLETNINRIKTALGNSFYNAVTDASNWLNGFLETLLPDESAPNVLDEFAKIDLKTQDKLDEIAQKRILKYSMNTAVMTGMSPFAMIDRLIVLSSSLGMLKELLELYSLKPRWDKNLVLMAQVIINTYCAGVIDELSDSALDNIASVAEKSAVQIPDFALKIAGKTTESAMHGCMVYRLGKSALKILHPVDNQ